MRVADQAATSVLRAVTGWHTLPSAPFFHPLASGWVGIEPAAVAVISKCLQTYPKQLHHAIVMVRHSTQHGLYEAVQRFHLDMPCVRRGLSMYCKTELCTSYTCSAFASACLPSALNWGRAMSCVGRHTPGKLLPSTNGWTRAT